VRLTDFPWRGFIPAIVGAAVVLLLPRFVRVDETILKIGLSILLISAFIATLLLLIPFPRRPVPPVTLEPAREGVMFVPQLEPAQRGLKAVISFTPAQVAFLNDAQVRLGVDTRVRVIWSALSVYRTLLYAVEEHGAKVIIEDGKGNKYSLNIYPPKVKQTDAET
jgi:hypothetical protein